MPLAAKDAASTDSGSGSGTGGGGSGSSVTSSLAGKNRRSGSLCGRNRRSGSDTLAGVGRGSSEGTLVDQGKELLTHHSPLKHQKQKNQQQLQLQPLLQHQQANGHTLTSSSFSLSSSSTTGNGTGTGGTTPSSSAHPLHSRLSHRYSSSPATQSFPCLSPRLV